MVCLMDGKGKLANRKSLIVLALVIILIIDIVVRLGLTKYVGLFEPDGFFHYAVISYAIAHGLSIPATLNLSGFQVHNSVGETEGFYYVTIIPWLLLGKTLSYYTVMRYIPILFGMLDALGAFFLARYLVKSNSLGLLAAFFVAVSNGDISRTAALVYRGDGFSTIFVIVSVIFLIKGLQAAKTESGKANLRKVLLFGLGSAFMLSLASALWNGAPYAEITYMLAMLLVIVYGFISARKELLKGSVLLMLTFLADYLLVHAYMAVKIIRAEQALTSLHYFLFYLPVLAASLIAWFIVANKDRMAGIAGSTRVRAYLIIALLLIGTVAILAVGGGYISKVASGGGLVIAQNNLTKTIQELQKPTFGFLFSSFMLQLFIGPIGVILFLLFSRRIEEKEKSAGTEGTAHSWFGISITSGFLVLLAYITTTLYLQLNAIRFNSLLAVPLAVFSAYGIYGAYVLVRDTKIRGVALRYVAIGVIAAILVYAVVFSYLNSMESVQADGINSQFLTAMSWMRNNTPTGATVLALWPDGSVVEGWAHRTSLMDSVGGQSSALIYNFSRFLFNNSLNSTYFYDAGKPEYVVSRTYWMAEMAGIAQEGNITGQAASPYGYTLMSSYNRKAQGNESIYTFSSSGPIDGAALIVNTTANGTESTNAYIHLSSQKQYYRIANVIFYNTTSLKAQLVSSANTTGELNYTLMLFYSGLNIEGAAMLGPSLPGSNFFRLVYTCASAGTCKYTGPDGNVTLSLVYANTDTRIYKATYS